MKLLNRLFKKKKGKTYRLSDFLDLAENAFREGYEQGRVDEAKGGEENKVEYWLPLCYCITMFKRNLGIR